MPTPVCGFSQPSSSATPAGHAAVQLSSEPVCRPAETPDTHTPPPPEDPRASPGGGLVLPMDWLGAP